MPSLPQDLARAAQEAGHPVPKTLTLTLDVSDPASIEAAAKEVERELGGRLDVLINNAGVFEALSSIRDSEPEGWWDTFTVNLRGTYLVTRAFLPLLLNGDAKQIINVSSIGAHWLFPGCSAYQTSKLALVRFTEFVQVEYGERGIICVAVHPGNVETDILAKWPPGHKRVEFTDSLALAADTMVWLCAERREWLRGRYVSCTWDVGELEGRRAEIVEKDLLKFRMAF